MIRNRYNQVPHLYQDTKRESNKITIYITNNSQEVTALSFRWPQDSSEQTRKHDKHKT